MPVYRFTFEMDAVAPDVPPRNFRLRYSNDGGNNYSDWRNLDCGDSGDFIKPLVVRRLGMTRHRIWETSDTSPVAQDIVAASIMLEAE